MVGGYDGYREEEVPEVGGEGRMNSGKDRDEVMFICADGAFSEV